MTFAVTSEGTQTEIGGSREPVDQGVCLAQRNVQTSAWFDWDYLLHVWKVMGAARQDRITNPGRPKATHDVAGYRRGHADSPAEACWVSPAMKHGLA